VALCEKFALPVVEKPGALFANFPKDHPLYQGTDIKPFWNDMDLAIIVRARVPWYPPSNRPPRAVVAMVDEAPHNSAMVYQSHQADMYLEGNAAQTLRDLAAAATVDKAGRQGARSSPPRTMRWSRKEMRRRRQRARRHRSIRCGYALRSTP
jgi:acetolactate synthase-1/2/3 large subunit